MLALLFMVFQLCFAVFFLYLCVAFVTGAPFVPSTNAAADSMVRLAAVRPGSRVYDLGSGDGRLLFLAAKAGAAKAIGYEINPFLVLYTNLRAILSPHRGVVSAVWRDFRRATLQDADAVFVYLLPWKMDALQRKLTATCRPGTRIVSNSFIFPGWKAEADDAKNHVYVFRIPASGKTRTISA